MDAMNGTTRRWTKSRSSVSSCCCFFFFFFFMLWMASVGNAQNASFSDVMLDPTELKQMLEGTNHVFTWYSNISNIARVEATVQEEMILDIASIGSVMEGGASDNASLYGHINVSALFIGYSEIYLEFYDELGMIVAEETVSASVVLSYQKINDIFTLAIGILVAIAYINMGATMKLCVVKDIIKKPVGPLLGVICQYIFMPLIAFGLGKVVFPGNPMAQLGMFLSGASPGGGLSNMWTHLLGGSLDLSIMMTFVSNIIAFGSLPLWVFMMGPVILGDADFVIPYKDIAVLVVSLTVPCGIGILIGRFLPRVAKILEKMLTPFSIFNILFIFTFGVYANRYIFSYFTFQTILVGFLSPFLGYLSGMLLAKLCCQPTKDIIAISIETGVQNNTVAFIILKLTFEKPAGDITAIFPCAAVLMTPLPLLVALFIKRMYECRTRSKSQDFTDEKMKKSLENGELAEGVDKPKKQDTVAISNGTTQPPEGGGLDNPAADLKDEAV